MRMHPLDWEIMAMERGFVGDVVAMLKSMAKKMTRHQMADELGVTFEAIRSKMQDEGLTHEVVHGKPYSQKGKYVGPRGHYNKG